MEGVADWKVCLIAFPKHNLRLYGSNKLLAFLVLLLQIKGRVKIFHKPLDALPKMKTSPVPAPSARPRFHVRGRHGQLQLIICLTLEVEDVQALQDQLSRGVVATLIRDITQIVKPKAP